VLITVDSGVSPFFLFSQVTSKNISSPMILEAAIPLGISLVLKCPSFGRTYYSSSSSILSSFNSYSIYNLSISFSTL